MVWQSNRETEHGKAYHQGRHGRQQKSTINLCHSASSVHLKGEKFVTLLCVAVMKRQAPLPRGVSNIPFPALPPGTLRSLTNCVRVAKVCQSVGESRHSSVLRGRSCRGCERRDAKAAEEDVIPLSSSQRYRPILRRGAPSALCFNGKGEMSIESRHKWRETLPYQCCQGISSMHHLKAIPRPFSGLWMLYDQRIG